ncbi:hypothetical protein WR25_08947 [Diploscapter pachys]|uniref:Major facilitator superfamily (MFS) profile domain-containing protein n=1 Tax=Diploscapter pachys TaxID=2018661 RepID=A0A2A2KCE1_9BILA|nr:hypothetical protein WR25_08947 [Diploscapter pachys]
MASYAYNFAAAGVPGLTFMTRYLSGDNGRAGEAGIKEWERDAELAYVVQGGPLKGLGVRLRNYVYRSDFARGRDSNRVYLTYDIALCDFQIGIIGTAFTLVYAIAGLPLARIADTGSRSKLMGWGLLAWSGLTAVNGMVGSFWSFLLVRMGVGIGEASYAPAANSLIGDLFPAGRRARAMCIFMLGLPLGLLLAFFTIGAMVEAFGTWRAPFFIAAVPGVLLALFIFMIREPARGAAETVAITQTPLDRPLRRRYFALTLHDAAVATGMIVGLSGLVGLTLGGWMADKVHQRFANGRLVFAALSMLVATLCTAWALHAGRIELGGFVAVFGAQGLHDAMYLIPVALLLTMVFLLAASRCFSRDAQRMREGMVLDGAAVAGQAAQA